MSCEPVTQRMKPPLENIPFGRYAFHCLSLVKVAKVIAASTWKDQMIKLSRSHPLPSFSQESLKGRLVNDHIPDSTKPLSSRLLLLQQLPPPGNVAGMELGQNVFSKRLQCLASDDVLPYRSLNDDLCAQFTD
jgi:hypothetical protein